MGKLPDLALCSVLATWSRCWPAECLVLGAWCLGLGLGLGLVQGMGPPNASDPLGTTFDSGSLCGAMAPTATKPQIPHHAIIINNNIKHLTPKHQKSTKILSQNHKNTKIHTCQIPEFRGSQNHNLPVGKPVDEKFRNPKSRALIGWFQPGARHDWP